MKKRIEWLDMARGLAMLLVIIGHTLSTPIIRGIIYSFHMPLFFFIGMLTYRKPNGISDFKIRLDKSAKQLLIPVLLIWCLQSIFLYDGGSKTEWLKIQLESLVWSSGFLVDSYGMNIIAIGMPWFLVVLFFSRALFDGIVLLTKDDFVKSAIVIGLLGVLGVYLGVKNYWLPGSFDITLAVLPIMLIGSIFRDKIANFSKKSLFSMIILYIVWAGTLGIEYLFADDKLEFATRDYPLFPLVYLTAIAFILAFMIMTSKLERFIEKYLLLKWVSFIGRNSLIVFLIHALEDKAFRGIWQLTDNEYINLVIRLVFNIGCLFSYYKIKDRYGKYKNNNCYS